MTAMKSITAKDEDLLELDMANTWPHKIQQFLLAMSFKTEKTVL